MLNWIVWNRTDYLYKIDLALNNLQRLICHKTQTTNQLLIPHKVNNKCFFYLLTDLHISASAGFYFKLKDHSNFLRNNGLFHISFCKVWNRTIQLIWIIRSSFSQFDFMKLEYLAIKERLFSVLFVTSLFTAKWKKANEYFLCYITDWPIFLVGTKCRLFKKN